MRSYGLSLAALSLVTALGYAAASGPQWIRADLSTPDSLGNPVKIRFRIPMGSSGWSEGGHPLGLNTHWYAIQIADSTFAEILKFKAALVLHGRLEADPTFTVPVVLDAKIQNADRRYRATSKWAAIDDTLVTELIAWPNSPFGVVVLCDYSPGALGEVDAELLFSGLPDGARVVRSPRLGWGCALKALYR